MPDDGPTLSKYASYQAEVKEDVTKCLEQMGCQPILFVGSGLSKRYFGGPNWDELLSYLAKSCPLIDKDYAYYKQGLPSKAEIGEVFAAKYHEWAWSTGKNSFPADLFGADIPASVYIKHYAAAYLVGKIPKKIEDISSPELVAEISLMQEIRPHAVVTTNYDQFLEMVFPDLTPIIGQNIIRATNFSFGEIFKIHGCVSDPKSIVLTKADYDHFLQRKKYLSAKLLTFFTEHPLIFLGYSGTDLDIQAILSDIDEALPETEGIIPNVYMVEWQPYTKSTDYPARERLIAIQGGKGVRIKSISSSGFGWIFEALGSKHNHPKISARVLRTLMVRSHELVRHDIPKNTIEANFEFLEGAVANSASFAKLFGITTIADPTALSATYPYNLTQVGKKLIKETLKERAYPNKAKVFIDKLKKSTGFDMQTSDNKYHRTEKYGKSKIHKYSEAACTLLLAVRDGTPYSL